MTENPPNSGWAPEKLCPDPLCRKPMAKQGLLGWACQNQHCPRKFKIIDEPPETPPMQSEASASNLEENPYADFRQKGSALGTGQIQPDTKRKRFACDDCGGLKSIRKSISISELFCFNPACETARTVARKNGISLPPPPCKECKQPQWWTIVSEKKNEKTDEVQKTFGWACTNDKLKQGQGRLRVSVKCPNFKEWRRE